MSELTRLLHEVETTDADPDAAVAVLYDELRRLARGCMRGERPDHTLAPTALANEAWLRLVGAGPETFATPGDFFAAAAQALRRILVEHSRRRAAQKRGGDRGRSGVAAEELPAPEREARLLELDAALERFAAVDPLKARLVELRFYGGLSVAEVARVLGMSERTVARDWRVARAFLRAELGDGDAALADD